MILLSVKDGRKYFGETRLFDNLSFHIDEGQKAGLVGVNGAGKTSLFKVLTGEMALDSGELFISPSASIGYMKQNIEYNSEKTVWQELIDVFSQLTAAEKELDSIRRALENGEGSQESLIKRQAFLMQEYEREGGFEYKSRAKGALIGLGFKEQEFARPFKELSGGEKTRLLLCRLLLGKHKLLLLDEPTNHLDMSSIQWLEGFLKSYNGSFIVISHDRYFLDKTTNVTLGLQNGRVQTYTGSYSDFMAKRDSDEAAKVKKFELQKKEIHRIEGIIAQQKQWNRERNIKTAESKQKMIDRIEAEMDAPDEQEKAINFSFSAREGGANEVLVVHGVTKSFGAKTLVKNADLEVRRGERVFLIGDNGCGKTTMLKMILGKEKQDFGTIKIGNGIYVGYYEQQHQSLNPEKTVFDEIADTFPTFDRTKIRNGLAAFLFKNDDCFKLIGDLSGGEKARVLLLKIMFSDTNFLILDEPTNHLDIFSKEALEDALRSYDGTILAVSHDRYFINSTADKIYEMKDSRLTCYAGNYDYCLEKSQSQSSSTVSGEAKKNGNDYREQKEFLSKLRKAEGLVARTESAIADCEAQIDKLEKLLFSDEAADIDKAVLWHDEQEKLKAQLSELYEQWDLAQNELCELREQQ